MHKNCRTPTKMIPFIKKRKHAHKHYVPWLDVTTTLKQHEDKATFTIIFTLLPLFAGLFTTNEGITMCSLESFVLIPVILACDHNFTATETKRKKFTKNTKPIHVYCFMHSRKLFYDLCWRCLQILQCVLLLRFTPLTSDLYIRLSKDSYYTK